MIAAEEMGSLKRKAGSAQVLAETAVEDQSSLGSSSATRPEAPLWQSEVLRAR